MTFAQYFSGLFKGIGSLLTGMSVTIREFFKKKITQQYPENRDTLVIPPRVRGNLTMPHDDNNEHACTACGICQMNCPNGTIQVISEMQEIDGKKKRVLVDYFYDLGQCTFCNLCVLTCPSDAIKFSNEFENAVFNHAKLKEKLNNAGSKLREKKVAPKPAPAAATGGTEKPVPKPAVAATEEKPASTIVSTTVTEEKPATEPKLPPADPDKPVPDVEAPVEKTEEESLTLQENKKTVEQIAVDDVNEEERREKMAEQSLNEDKNETSATEKKQEPKEDKE